MAPTTNPKPDPAPAAGPPDNPEIVTPPGVTQAPPAPGDSTPAVTDNGWSLGGEPPGPAYMPSYTPEESAAIRAEIDKDRVEAQERRTKAIATGVRKAKALQAAKAKAEAESAAKVEAAEQKAGIADRGDY